MMDSPELPAAEASIRSPFRTSNVGLHSDIFNEFLIF